MIADLLYLFFGSLLISLTTFGGGAQALIYQLGVTQTHWLARNDLTAAFAFGYATPGPAVFGALPFIGYGTHGITGAVVGLFGIFTMPFLLSIFAVKYFGQILEHPYAAGFVKGVGLSATGLLVATSLLLLDVRSAHLWQVAVTIVVFFASLRYKINPLYSIIGGGLMGLLL